MCLPNLFTHSPTRNKLPSKLYTIELGLVLSRSATLCDKHGCLRKKYGEEDYWSKLQKNWLPPQNLISCDPFVNWCIVVILVKYLDLVIVFLLCFSLFQFCQIYFLGSCNYTSCCTPPAYASDLDQPHYCLFHTTIIPRVVSPSLILTWLLGLRLRPPNKHKFANKY